MKWFDSAIAWLFPAVLVEGTPWGQLWREKDRASFVLGVRVFFPIVAIVYIAHYFFYDKVNNLEPLEFWLVFRLFMAGSSVFTLAFYFSPAVRWPWFKAPAIAMCWLICQSQAYVTIWHSVEAWVFCYVLIVGCVLALRLSALKSTLFVAFTTMTQAPILIEAGIPSTYIFTGALVSVAVALIARASYLDEVRSFLLNQENLLAHKKIIELNMEFADRIRSFIPKVIAERIDDCMDNHRMSVLEASIEVLTPTVKEVSCLFSDIRGFTKQSKDIRDFVQESVIPEVKACTDSIESFDGIPRKIGDLIFAYFDGDMVDQNLLKCVAAGMMVSRLNHDMNATFNTKSIKRYVLVSCGEALVGNLGGLDSSIEITALGPPVNLLSRIDEATKIPAVAMRLSAGDLVLSEAASRMVARLAPAVHQTPINLDKIGVSIRDFEEVSCIYTIAPNDLNFAAVRRALDESSPPSRDARDPRIIAA
jgi:class 3 adenylate cyclase